MTAIGLGDKSINTQGAFSTSSPNLHPISKLMQDVKICDIRRQNKGPLTVIDLCLFVLLRFQDHTRGARGPTSGRKYTM
jgi:hypothetical protein